MDKKVIYIICVVIFAILLIVTGTLLNKGNKQELSNISNGETSKDSNKSIVLEVNSQIFENEILKSEKPVIVDFYASWCPPCKQLSPIVEEVAKEKSDIKVVKLNVDNNKDISNKFGINSIPTLVFIKDGKEVKRITGLVGKEVIENMITEKF